ncbi:MAG: hypothetical protein M1820_006018 [Bogoriella megaspora]|nr:MAG: hypothetical protein M1820_006018 [Bogoriella megaspora]
MEERFGNIFACAPAIRQFIAYRQRVGTVWPTASRQKPNEDFVKSRRQITLRDIFWYRHADFVNNQIFEAKPIVQKAIEPPPTDDIADLEKMAHASVLDSWLWKGRKRDSDLSGTTYSGYSDRSNVHNRSSDLSPVDTNEQNRIDRSYRSWGLLREESPNLRRHERNSTRQSFLLNNNVSSSHEGTTINGANIDRDSRRHPDISIDLTPQDVFTGSVTTTIQGGHQKG